MSNTTVAIFYEHLQQQAMIQLRAELDEKQKEIDRLTKLVKAVPEIVLIARLDAKQGIPTKLSKDYYL